MIQLILNVAAVILVLVEFGQSNTADIDITRFREISNTIYTAINRQDFNKIEYGQEKDNNTFNKESVIEILDQIESSKTCKYYTQVMAYKHVLSQYVFNNDTLDSTYIIKLTGIMINLQTAALKLQNIKLAISKVACIEFTSEQYEQIYRSNEDKTDVLESLKDDSDIWRNRIINRPYTFN